MLEFNSVEEMQAHYKATRNRIANAPTKFRPKAPEPPPETVELPTYLTHSKKLPTPKLGASMTDWFADCAKFLETQRGDIPKRTIKGTLEGTLERPVVPPKIWLEEIVALVCLEVNLEPKDVWSVRRHQHLVQARFLVWALAREFCWQHSLPSIGKFCKRDHTTVMHGANQGKKIPAYPELARQVRAILSERESEVI
jgi:Bacterial dnaA protein helix-turn-helix